MTYILLRKESGQSTERFVIRASASSNVWKIEKKMTKFGVQEADTCAHS